MSSPNPEDVGFPTGGLTAIAPRSAVNPSAVQMADPNFAITSIPGWIVLGLRESGGAPEWAEAPAQPVESYEEGYKFSPANGTLTMTQTLIENSAAIQAAIRGVVYTDGVADIDIDKLNECKVYTEDRLRTKVGDQLERYMAPTATITGISKARNQRGTVKGTAVTTLADRSDDLEGRAHYRHALISADATPEPVVVSVIPAGQSVGEDVVIEGRSFTGATSVTIDGSVAIFTTASDSAIIATIPVGAAGVAPVIVTTPDGASEPVNYTVV